MMLLQRFSQKVLIYAYSHLEVYSFLLQVKSDNLQVHISQWLSLVPCRLSNFRLRNKTAAVNRNDNKIKIKPYSLKNNERSKCTSE